MSWINKYWCRCFVSLIKIYQGFLNASLSKFLVQPTHLLYLLEIPYDGLGREVKEEEEANLNANAKKFWLRPNVAPIADTRIQDINATNGDESDI